MALWGIDNKKPKADYLRVKSLQGSCSPTSNLQSRLLEIHYRRVTICTQRDVTFREERDKWINSASKLVEHAVFLYGGETFPHSCHYDLAQP